MADTAALVVALSAQLTKFEKDMRAAGIMAEKAVGDIEDKFSKMNPQVSASFLGNLFSNIVTKGIDAAVRALDDFVNGFVALKKAADLAEISLGKVYGLSAALGKDQEENAKFVEKLTVMLNDMRRGLDTPFGALKAQNPDFFKDMDPSKTFDVAENMARIAEMTKQAETNVEKWKIAEQGGATRALVSELEKGGAHFRTVAAGAETTGVEIAKAAAQATVLKDELYKAFTGLVKSAMEDFWKDNANLMEQAKSGLKSFREYAKNSWKPVEDGAANAAAAVDEFAGEAGRAGRKSSDSFADKWIDRIQSVQDKMSEAAKAAADLDKKATGKGTATADKDKPLARSAPSGGGGGSEADDWARANEQITKHIELMKADAAAVGFGVAEQERLRAETRLTLAANKEFGEVNAETALKIREQADAAAAAAQKLAEARHTMGEINKASATLGSALSTAFADAVVEGKKLDEVLQSLVKTLLKAAINSTVMSLFTPGAGGGLSPFAGLFKAAGGTNFAPGGMALVGEQGPELVNLPRGSQVMPADVTSGMMGGGGAIVYSPAIDARGASVEAVARLAQIMEQDRASFATRTVSTIQQARRARLPGV